MKTNVLLIDGFSFNGITAGDGYWSSKKKKLNHSKAELITYSFDKNLGELRIYFSNKEWKTDNDGLIYTDNKWLDCLRSSLVSFGFAADEANDVDYSEQGMQGSDYVSLDAGETFTNAVRYKLYKNDGALRPLL